MPNYKYLKSKNYLKIFSEPDWYLKLKPQLKEYFYDYKGDKKEKTKKWLEKREEFKKLVADLLKRNKIALGKTGKNFDQERLPIDTAVIHHSSTPAKESIWVIETLGLIRLYAFEYSQKENSFYGQPIWSGHFYRDRQTFVAYHYLIKNDGSFIKTLKDNYIGWHCGNWKYNRKSLAICFIGDLKNEKPTQKALKTAAKIIKNYPIKKILGHHEINKKTDCPGDLFLGNDGWKLTLEKLCS